MLRAVRPIMRLLRIIAVTVACTAATANAARRIPIAERPRYRAERQRWGTRKLCRILNIDVTVEGQLTTENPALIVSNHFGVLDPLVLASELPVAFVGKAELRHWPLVGWVCRTFGVVFVRRGDVRNAREVVRHIHDRMREGVNILVFPEGTTRPGPAPDRFKTGAFAAAAGSAYPVLPVYLSVATIDGRPASGPTRERVVWADSDVPFLRHFLGLLSIRHMTMTVRIGDAITAEGMDRRVLAELAHERVEQLRRGNAG